MRNVCCHNSLFLFSSTEKVNEKKKIHPIFPKSLDHLEDRAIVKPGCSLSGRMRACSSLREPLCAVVVKHSVLQEQTGASGRPASLPTARASTEGTYSTKCAWIVLLSTASRALCFCITYPGTGWAEPQPVSGSMVVFSVWAGNAFSAGQLRHVH